MELTLTPSNIKREISAALAVELVPMIWGSPGIGKSDIVRQIAKQANLFVIDKRLSTANPTDFSGFPYTKDGRSAYAPFNDIPIEGDSIPEGYNGWMLFFDEINSAPRLVQAASYQVILDKMVGLKRLHPSCYIIAAGNEQTDNAIVERQGTALQSRLIHFTLRPDLDSLKRYFNAKGLDSRIVDFWNFKPESIQRFNPNHDDRTFACPRTWEFLARMIQNMPEITKDRLPLMAGTIGEGMAREFYGFCQVYKELPTMQEILRSPESITMPQEPTVLFALTGALAEHAKDSTLEGLLKFVKRLPAEFQFITLQNILQRNPDLINNEHLDAWVGDTAAEYM